MAFTLASMPQAFFQQCILFLMFVLFVFGKCQNARMAGRFASTLFSAAWLLGLEYW